MLNQPFILGMNHTRLFFFIYHWISFANILFIILAHIFTMDIICRFVFFFFLLVMFDWLFFTPRFCYLLALNYALGSIPSSFSGKVCVPMTLFIPCIYIHSNFSFDPWIVERYVFKLQIFRGFSWDISVIGFQM